MKIFCYTDLQARAQNLFWHRDLGLLTEAFRALGHDAWLVVHPKFESASKIKNQKSKIPKEPAIWASPSEVRDPFWWQSHQPDLVILGLWTRPKYDPVRRAALSATSRIIERADSDGVRTASCGLDIYIRRRYDYCRDHTFRWPAVFSILCSALYALGSVVATPWIEARLSKTLKLLPALTVETPKGTQLWKKLAAKLGADPKRIHCIPHPIQTDIFRRDSSASKKNQIISVGRWESYQKNLPLLLRTLISFLDQHPSWSALVIGSKLPRCSPHPRLFYSAPLSPLVLSKKMQESKIFLSSSRYESFGLAAAEALASGCRVVAPQGVLDHLLFRQGLKHEPLLSCLASAALSPFSSPLATAPHVPSFSSTDIAAKFLDIP